MPEGQKREYISAYDNGLVEIGDLPDLLIAKMKASSSANCFSDEDPLGEYIRMSLAKGVRPRPSPLLYLDDCTECRDVEIICKVHHRH